VAFAEKNSTKRKSKQKSKVQAQTETSNIKNSALGTNNYHNGEYT